MSAQIAEATQKLSIAESMNFCLENTKKNEVLTVVFIRCIR